MGDASAELLARRTAIRNEMGGVETIRRLHAAGRLTARELIGLLIDDQTFEEIGTFAHSARPEDAHRTPGDGKIAGFGRSDGRAIAVIADDATVKRASSSTTGSAKVRRVWEQAIADGVPIVYFGETAGARIPDMLGSAGFVSIPPPIYQMARHRRVPLVTVITGDSFGGSSFVSALSDFVVQIEGTCLAVTSSRVIATATGEEISDEDLGGAAVHARTTGQIDRSARDAEDAVEHVRRFLSYLPSNQWSRSPVSDPVPPDRDDVAKAVPTERRRGYDVRTVLAGLVDGGSVFELAPEFGRSVVTTLARFGGYPVGVVASQPMHQAGSLTPDACDKITRLVCLCDAFDVPLVFLHDTPGFVVGSQVEHQRLLHKAMLLQQAVALASVPKLAVVLRKSFGLASHALAGPGVGADLLLAWPGAELSFMDPNVAARVIYERELQELAPEARSAEHERLAVSLARETTPYGAAGAMKIDEIVSPDETRGRLIAQLERSARRPARPPAQRQLSGWPACW